MNVTNHHPIHVLGGQSVVSTDPDTTFMTVLGSCVSACIYDPSGGVGGMNHFILPTGGRLDSRDRQQRYGDVAMRTLVDTVRKLGAGKRPLRAKLYGGRTRCSEGSDPGAQNIAFAQRFLLSEGIELIDSCLGSDLARWVTFHPASGRVWLKVTAENAASLPARAQVMPRSAALR